MFATDGQPGGNGVTNRVSETAKNKTASALGQDFPVPIEKKVSTKSMDDLRKSAEKSGGFLLYHGGLPDDIGMEHIDLDRLGTQQNKKGRTYGGFYLTDESSKDWTEKYAQERNGNVHGFLIAPTCRTYEAQGNDIDRLSKDDRNGLAQEYDLVKGQDVLGRVQYVLLNKEVVLDLGLEKIRIAG